MNLIERIRAVIAAEVEALNAYDAHRAARGQCVDYIGQDPAHHDEHGPCALHVQTSNAVRLFGTEALRPLLRALPDVLDELTSLECSVHLERGIGPFDYDDITGVRALAKGLGIEVPE